MAQGFSRELAQARRQAGFKSAYQFYHANGGRRHFPFTYVHYLRLENRGRLPRPGWLAVLLLSLRLSPGDAGSRRLHAAYLKDLLDGEENYAAIVGPLVPAGGGVPPGEAAAAMRLVKAEHVVHLTPEQFRAIAADEETYWCSEAVLGDEGGWTPGALAAALGFSAPRVRAGLARLARAGVVRRTASGRYRGRHPGRFYTFPGRLRGMAAPLAAVQGYWERMHRRSGGDVAARVELVRAEDGLMRRYAASLAETVESANAFATRSKGERTSFYLIEGRVRRLLPF